MGTLWQDIRYGARVLMRSPALTAAAVVAIALGVGANTAIFSVVNAVLLKPLPYEEPDRLAVIWERRPRQNRNEGPVSPADFIDWRSQNQVFERVAASSPQAFNLTGTGEPEQVEAQVVTPEFFQVLGARAALGRTLVAEVDRPGGERAAVLSHGFWQRRFGGAPDIVGRAVTLDTESYTVVGVMPPAFQYPSGRTEMWVVPASGVVPGVRLRGDPDPATLRSLHYLFVVGRLKPGVSLAQAQADMEAVAARLEGQYPEANTGHTARVVSLHEQLVGNVRPTLLILLGAVGFVLAVACANVANLLLARAAARQREVAVRSALGAGRARLVRQFLTESALLSLVGGGLGLLLAVWGVDVLVALGPENLPRLSEVGVDGRVILFTLCVSLATGLVFGLAPAWQSSRLDLTATLKEGGRSLTEGRGRLRGLLVVAEVALTVVLLIGAGLLLRSFWRLTEVNPGFDPHDLLTMELSLPRAKYAGEPQMAEFYRRVLERLAALPGVESAGATWNLPLSGQGAGTGLEIEGYTPPPNERTNSAFSVVSPNYFRTMRIPVVRGRDFTGADAAAAPGVVIVNEAFARRFFGGEEPLGKRLRQRGDENSWLMVVGVVGNVRHVELAAEPLAEMYLPYLQSPVPFMNVVLRTSVDPFSLAPALRREVWAVDADQPVANIGTMAELTANSVAGRRFNMTLLIVFAAVALVLAVIGLHGVMSYTVTRRTHEIGVRMALGARRGDVLRMVVRQGMMLALAGVALGVAGAFALTRVMSSLLYGVSATDAATFACIPVILTAVALLACYVPARRATKVDPMVALRYE